ncbi:nucleotidyl transferase AbiEii/AbiGii toxin family protein [Candidatus Palauibacter irciniicola]|uniref:nucleotidyl transferase AbiEii/AbiGii toxin family protein n=1 Tax=Candidatus Palauibacter irciniicola TaxID=3056733 RepID=UPI003B023379
MIQDAEIRRRARAASVEPRIVELDYALGWALRGIAGHRFLAKRLIFKGGTCLRKCYFPNYRFSEDLDFTATQWFGWEEFEKSVGEAFAAVQGASGIDFAAREPKRRVIDDEYGRESLKFTLYWRGPHASGGSPPGLRLDITRNEVLTFSPVSRPLFHPFSDAEDLGESELTCYALEEVMSEKVRAVLGQRLHAVSRDVYDIFSLLEHVDERKVRVNLPRKLQAREVELGVIDPGRLLERRDEFHADWERNLAHLLPPGAEREFEEVWNAVVEYVGRMATGLGDMP